MTFLILQARLARRQLPKVTQDGLVEYSVQIPAAALRSKSNNPSVSYGKDIDWILAGRKTHLNSLVTRLYFDFCTSGVLD